MAKKHQLTTSDHLPYDEFVKLLDGLRKDENYIFELFARLAFCTACRISDVLSIKWCDILKKSAFLITEKKTGKTRRITLNKSVQQKISELYRLLGSPNKEQYIFANKRTGRPISVQYVNKQLKRFKFRYGLHINNFSSHTFRKTFGRYVYDTNGHSADSLILLNRILNHSSIQITKTYIGITQEEINSVFDSINF